MADWFRSWHGAPTDNKWLTISRRASVLPGVVAAVAWALMDHASQAEDRGDVSGFDVETYAAFSGFDEEEVAAVVRAMTEKGMIAGGRLVNALPFAGVLDRQRLPWSRWREIRAYVFGRDDFTCTYCGKKAHDLECDHIIPLSQGGSNDIENLTTACARCNRSKHKKTPDQWRKS